MTSPIYDFGSGCVFAGDTNGIVYAVDSGLSTTASICNSQAVSAQQPVRQLIARTPCLIPIVDSTAEDVYVFIAGSVAISAGSRSCADGSNCIAEYRAATLNASTAVLTMYSPRAPVGRVIITISDSLTTYTIHLRMLPATCTLWGNRLDCGSQPQCNSDHQRRHRLSSTVATVTVSNALPVALAALRILQ